SNLEKYKNDLDKLIEEGELLKNALIIEEKTKNKDNIEINYSFKENYQTWYSESLNLIKIILPDRLNDFKKLYEKNGIEQYLLAHEHLILFSIEPSFNQQLSILKSAQSSLIDINSKSLNNHIFNGKDIFIVHGHNEEMKQSVARCIEKLKLNPIILHEQSSKGKTIIEKFFDYSNVIYAIILLSADDIAYPKDENSNNFKYRARQNVIFELGYFMGKLGRERVLSLYEEIDNFEIPSDYNGVLFIPYDKKGNWKLELVKELKAVGISIDANNII
ncbi:MAG TPA: nucleotide-binding protein, partial [Bacteroidales bacterium]|nr:nucleotide-binding protein [Bacteroidales bacterium]